MPALSDNVGLLFKIKADSDDAVKDLGKVKTEIGGLGASFAGLANPVALATVAITAIGTAAVATSKALFDLAKSASDYGSELYDAQVKTGLTAATLSTLKLNADSAGSSFEQVSGSVGKFTVLLGQANQGSEAAQATLKKYGITATDVNGALEQAVKNISEMATADERAAAAKELFKDRTGAVLPVIEQMSGNLAEARERAIKLGTALSEDDVRAADQFGDALKLVSTQIEVAATKFALAYAPVITEGLAKISQFLSENKDEWARWGEVVGNIIVGTIEVARVLADQVKLTLFVISAGLINQKSVWSNWAQHILFTISPILWALEKIGALMKSTSSGKVQEGMGGGGASVSMPRIGGGGGSGRAGGAGGGGSASNSALQDAQAAMRQKLDISKAGDDEELAMLDRMLKEKQIAERDYVTAVADIHQRAIQREIDGYNKILTAIKLNAKEREDIANKVGVLEIDLATDKIKSEIKLIDLQQREGKEIDANAEKEKRRHKQYLQQLTDEANASGVTDSEKAAKKLQSGLNLSILGDSALLMRNEFGNIEDTIKPIFPVLQMAGQAFQGLAAGIGSVVQNLVLMGSTGPGAMKKLVAGVLAGVSAQAATMAIMELAYGFAALTPWGAAIYGSPALHFKAAALFAAVAAGAGLAGRGVAGNAFQNQTSGGGSSGGSSQQTSRGDKFTEAFSGFGQRMDRMNERLNTVLGGVEEQLHNFATKFSAVTPGHVVMAGAGDGAQAIFDAHTSVLGSGGNATESMVRAQGRFR